MSPQERLEHVVKRVAAAGVDLRDIGGDRWRGDCVRCGGSDRLVVRLDLNGHVWFSCYGRCEHDEIAAVLELSHTDLRGARAPAGAHVTFATDVKAQRVRWLIPGRVPLGAVTLLAGDPKLGKSTLSCLYAAAVSNGTDPAIAIVVSAEDSFARIIKPRVHAAGADLARIAAFDVVDEDGPRLPDLPEDVDALRGAIAEHRARLVIIDPLNAFLSSQLDSWKDHGIRRALAPLARVAEELDVAILIVVHLNKQRGGDALYRIGGSIGQVGAARSVLSFGRDPDDPAGELGDQRLLGHLACNWAALAPTELYALQTVEVDLDGERIETSRLAYQRDVEAPASDAFRGRARDERGEDSEDAIAELLADGEPHSSREIKTAVMDELHVTTRTVERAAKRLVDRGELLVLERSSSGQGGARRATEWQRVDRGHDTPITERVVTSDGTVQSQVRGHDTDGNGDVVTSDEPFDLDEIIQRAKDEPDPPWAWWR